MAVIAYRQALGRQGRAILSAIDRSRSLMKELGERLKPGRGWQPLNGEPPAVGTKVSFVDLASGVSRIGTVFCYKMCNEEQRVTQGWVIVERSRYERERDKRLSRFIAVPFERARKVK